MGNIIFKSEFYSNNGIRYKVELFGEDYIGLPNLDIIGGTGNTFYVDKDWRDFLQVGQELVLYIDGVSQSPLPIITSIYSNGITTQITTNVAYSATYDQIGNTYIVANQYIPNLQPDIIDIQTEWNGEGDEILASIKSSSTSVTYSNNDTWFDRFFEYYQTTQDNKLKLLVYRYTTDWSLDWAGIIVMDLIQWSNTSKPRPYTFKAIDGLDALKKYEYTQTTLSVNKIVDNVFEILDILGLKQFWSSSDAYIRESIEYQSKIFADFTQNYSPIDYTYIPDNMFIGDTNETPTQFISYYDALKGLMDLFSCRIYHANGVYWIQQVRNFESNSITFREFLKDGTYTLDTYTHQKSVGNSGSEDLNILSGGTFGYFAGAYRTRLEAKQHIEGKIPIDFMSVKSHTLGPVDSNPNQRELNIGSIKGNGLENIRISMRIRTQRGEPFNNLKNYSCQIDVELFTTEYYLRGLGNPPHINGEWRNDLVNSPNAKMTKIVKNTNGETFVVFDTPSIDFDGEFTLRITPNYIGKDDFINDNIALDYSTAFIIDRIQVRFPQEQSTDNNKMILEVENPSGFYTKEVELDPLIIVDSQLGTSTIAKLLIDQNAKVSGSSPSLVESTNWYCDFDEIDPFLSYARVLEAMSLQTKPLEKISTGLVGDYYPFNSIAYNNKVYVFSGCTRNYKMDEINGEWFEQISARSEIVINKIGDVVDKADRVNDVDMEVINNTNKIYRGIGELTPIKDSSITYAGFEFNRVQNDGGIFEGEDYIDRFFPDINVVQEINIPQYTGDRIYEGDIISVINANNNNEIDFFEVTADVPIGAINIPVVEKETTYPINEGDIPVFKKGEVTESNKVRADLFQMKGNALAPTPEGGGDYFKNGEFMFYNSHIYWRDIDGNYHSLQGNTHHPE